MKNNTQVLLAFVAGGLAGAAVAFGVVKLMRESKPTHEIAAAAKGVSSTTNPPQTRASRGTWWSEDPPTPAIDDAMPRGFSARWSGTHRVGTSTNDATPPTEEQRRQWMEEGFQRFASMWSNQAVEARSNLIQSAGLSDEDVQRFDIVLASMNVRLSSLLDPVLDDTQKGWRPNAEERANLMHDVSGVLVTTYDELSKNLPAELSNAANSNDVSLVQFADPRYMPFLRGMRSWRGRPDGGPRSDAAQSQNR